MHGLLNEQPVPNLRITADDLEKALSLVKEAAKKAYPDRGTTVELYVDHAQHLLRDPKAGLDLLGNSMLPTVLISSSYSAALGFQGMSDANRMCMLMLRAVRSSCRTLE